MIKLDGNSLKKLIIKFIDNINLMMLNYTQ